jgi:hypothetical protein
MPIVFRSQTHGLATAATDQDKDDGKDKDGKSILVFTLIFTFVFPSGSVWA